MKPTNWIKTLDGNEPEFFCPRCGNRLTLYGGGGPDWDGMVEPPDSVECSGCGFIDNIEW